MGLKEYSKQGVLRSFVRCASGNPLLLALAVLWLFPVSGISAQEEPQFSQMLQDFPLMPGTEELSDSFFIYDKPQGRFIQLSLNAEQLDKKQIQKFYALTLPQFGWHRDQTNVFSRGREDLIFDYSTLEQDGYFTVTIRPDVS